MKTTHKKLVRDRIPEIIREDGKTPVCRTLSQEEYLAELRKKLQEEVREFLEANDPAELADICEVIDAFAELLGGKERILQIQQHKRESNGAFAERIFLESVLSEE